MSRGYGVYWPRVFMHAEGKKTASEIAREEHVTLSAVVQAARRYGVELKRARPGRKLPADIDEQFRAALMAGEGASRFCIRTGISSGALRKLEHRHGLKLPRSKRSHAHSPKIEVLIKEDQPRPPLIQAVGMRRSRA